MIIDTLENIKNYKGLGRVYQALEFIANTDFSETPVGKYHLDGDNIFYMVQEYETKSNNNLSEAHKKHIDIQLIVNGEECIGYAPLSCEKTLIRDNTPEGDSVIYECKNEKLTLKAGTFMILFPNDIHQPGLSVGVPAKCRKVVVKVRID